MEWTQLTSLNQLEKIKEESKDRHVVIFKHSTSCYISKMVLNGFESNLPYDQLNDAYSFYFLDLIKYRSVSNKIAEDFNVRHESPQLIVIKDSIAVHNSSHSSISVEEMLTHSAR